MWEGTKFFSIVLLQNFRLHAFVPGNVAEKIGPEMTVGKILKVSNFTVKEYRVDEKFRPINTEKQIFLTNYTQVESVECDDGMIAKDMFDFYDLSDLAGIANDNTYLTGNYLHLLHLSNLQYL